MSNIISNPEEFGDEYPTAEICERCQCCEKLWVDCWACGGEGGTDGDELVMEDPMWYDKNDFRQCDICEGKGGWYRCTCDENGKHKNTINEKKTITP